MRWASFRGAFFSLISVPTLNVVYPEQRAVNHGAVVAGQAHDPRLDDEAAEFD